MAALAERSGDGTFLKCANHPDQPSPVLQTPSPVRRERAGVRDIVSIRDPFARFA
jgi:hypothetical protein